MLGPRLVRARLSVEVEVDDVDNSGSVSTEIAGAVEGLLDQTTGALDGLGWRLGETPSETDFAAAVAGLAHVEGVVGFVLQRIPHDPGLQFAPVLRADQLLRVDPGDVQVIVRIPEAVA